MVAPLLLALFFVLISIIVVYNCFLKRQGLPPGPVPVPLFGNSLTLMRNAPGEDCFLEWRERFGNIFTFWLGETPIVCIAEYGKIVEHYQRGGEPFAGRHAIEAYERIIRGGIVGVLQTEGDVWREHRRFALHVFRDFGVGKNLMQERILSEIESMFKSIDAELVGSGHEGSSEQECTDALNIVRHFERAISSIINALLVGFRFDEAHDREYNALNDQLWRFNNRMQNFFTNLLMWRPELFKRLPLCRESYNLVRDTHDCFFGFFDRQIQAHLAHMEGVPIDELRDLTPLDFMEAFLREKLARDELGEEHSYSLEQLKAVCFDLWISGQETTTTALAWGIALILHNPEVANKIHAELDSAIGDEHRLICWADRNALPYISATINEILRVGNVVAQDFPHRMTRDTPVNGWLLRKGQPIVAQISVVLMDPQIFPDPKSFRPERFLDAHGNLLKSEQLIPFGLGKRQCLGEALARMELFLFFANIFNRYEISPGPEMPSLKREMGIPVLCPKFTCRVQRRQPEQHVGMK